MSLDFKKPDVHLARELGEVSRDATALIDVLTKGLNSELPLDLPREQLVDLARSLAQLPYGTAEGCRPALEYARNRLPAIRRAHIIAGEELSSTKSGSYSREPVLRGAMIDHRLRDLIASVTTALDEYQRLAAEESNDPPPEASVSVPREMTEDATSRSDKLEKDLVDAQRTVGEIARPESVPADNLKRQISDAEGLNRLARTELRMPKTIVGWYRRTLNALAEYPRIIRTTAATLKDGADILHVGLDRWHDFERNGTVFLVDEFKKTCDAFIAVAAKLEGRKRLPQSGTIEPPQDFDEEFARAMILLGMALPDGWSERVTNLDFAEAKITNLAGLAHLTNLERLVLKGTQVSNIVPLSELTALRHLDLANTSITNAQPLSGLVNLTYLDLESTSITDTTPLAGLKNLTYLNLNRTSVRSLEGLSELAGLTDLDFSSTQVSSLTPLSRLVDLIHLCFVDAPIADATPLANLVKLKLLDIEGTLVSNVEPLSALVELESLGLDRTQVSSIEALSSLDKLGYLNLKGSKVQDLSPVEGKLRLELYDANGALVPTYDYRLRQKRRKKKKPKREV